MDNWIPLVIALVPLAIGAAYYGRRCLDLAIELAEAQSNIRKLARYLEAAEVEAETANGRACALEGIVQNQYSLIQTLTGRIQMAPQVPEAPKVPDPPGAAYWARLGPEISVKIWTN